jgi:hypothetical protein
MVEVTFLHHLLEERCAPVLRGDGPFDIAVNQATLALEVTLRCSAEYKGKETGANLVSAVLNGDPRRALLRISHDAAEQEGFANLCRGVMQYYRNPTHHDLRDISLQEATTVCLMIDQLLRKIPDLAYNRALDYLAAFNDQIGEE